MRETCVQGPASASFRTAELLLEIEAVHFMREEPFTLASGLPSPVYIDCRKIVSFPQARTEIVGFLVDMIRRIAERSPLEVLAGGETAGIPFAALAADRLNMPMCYIRKKPKGYGRNARIEGQMEPGSRVLLIEDLATDGGSKLSFVQAIRDADCTCDLTTVVFYYGIFGEADHLLSEAGISLHYLCNWTHLVDVAKKRGRLQGNAADEVEGFLADPRKWQADHAP